MRTIGAMNAHVVDWAWFECDYADCRYEFDFSQSNLELVEAAEQQYCREIEAAEPGQFSRRDITCYLTS